MRASEEELRAMMMGGLDGNAGDHAALLRAIVPLLQGYYRRRASESEIDDLVQETLIAVHLRRATYDRSRAFTPWLFAIARYKMIDLFRRSRRMVPMEGLDEILVAEGFEAASSARLDVDRLLDTLPPKQARSIRATHVDGLTTAEAAARAGISESDVKISVHRGLKMLIARVQGDRR